MKLWEINQQIMSVIAEAEENGYTDETINLLNDLSIKQDEKRENIALVIKNLKSDEKQLEEWKREADNKLKANRSQQEWLKNYLACDLAGEKFKTPKVSVYYMHPERTVLPDDLSKLPEEYREVSYKAKTEEIKKAIKSGILISGCSILSGNSMVIK